MVSTKCSVFGHFFNLKCLEKNKSLVFRYFSRVLFQQIKTNLKNITFSEPMQNLGRFFNTALALRSMSVEANLLTPLSLATDTYPLRNSFRKLDGVNYNPDLAYHTAAILASTMVI